MRTNLYKSNGQTFDDEAIINDIDELADYVNDRYSLDSEAEVVDGSFSVIVLTGNAHNILFEAFTQGDETVCGCPALNDYVTANEEWAEDIIENASLTKADIRRDKGYAIIDAVSEAVADEMDSELNYSEDTYMKELRLPCAVHEIDSIIFNAERTLDKLYDDITNKLEKMVKKALKERTETMHRAPKLHLTRHFECKNVLHVPCILKENRRRRYEGDESLSDAVDVIEGKDSFTARAFKFEVRPANSNGMIKNGKFVGKLSANLTMRYEGAECSVSITDTKAEMTIDEMPDVTTSLYAVTVQLPTNRRDVQIEREGDGYVIHIAADCNVDCPETMKSFSSLCYCHFTFHVTNKRTVGKMSAWILEGVDDRMKKRGSRRGRSSLAGLVDLDMFSDGTSYDDIDYALNSGDFSSLF